MAGPEVKVESGGGFFNHLYRASDLLGEGRAEEALDESERAVALQPDSIEALSLQASALFKLQRYDDAINTYEIMIEMNPREPTIHVNLALVCIKAGRLDDAETALRRGLSNGGDSRRLHGYLGLVYSKKMEFEKALIAFNKAKSPKMVAEMEEMIRKRQKGLLDTAGNGSGQGSSALETAMGVEVERSQSEAIAAAQRRRKLLRLNPQAAQIDVPEVAPVQEAEPGAAPARPGKRPGQAANVPLVRDASMPLRVETPSLLRVALTSGVVIRLTDSALLNGEVQAEPLYKRFRGQTTAAIFGGQSAPFCKVQGSGDLFLSPQEGRQVYLFEIESKEKAFVLEDVLYGFTANLTWENGRIGTAEDASFDLVTLAGNGSFCVTCNGEASEVHLDGGEIVVPQRSLLGWLGKLVPRVVEVPAGLPPDLGTMVRLKGTGRVIIGRLA